MKTVIATIALVCATEASTAFAQDKEAPKPGALFPAQAAGGAAMNLTAANKAPVKEAGTVIGKVVDANNNPLQGAAIDVVLNIPRPPKVGDAPQPRRPVLGHASSLEDGTFKIENVPVGSYILHIHYNKPTPACRPGGAPAYEVKANQTVDLGTLMLQFRNAGGAATPSK